MLIHWSFIVSICIWVVALDEPLPIFFTGLFLLLVLRQQGFSVLNMIRTFKLLLWLFIPTLIFNGLFISGIYIQYPMPLPLTEEGLSRGLYLCTHVGVAFFSALVVMRVFSKGEWLQLVDRSPMGAWLKPYLWIIFSLKKNINTVLAEQKQVWLQMKPRWKHLPDMLVCILEQVIQEAKQEADKLWHTWDEQIQRALDVAVQPPKILYLLPLILGWGLFWLL